MKKITAIILALVMLLAFAACGETEEEPPVTVGADGVTGGWTVNTEFPEGTFPEEAKAALDAALEGLDGASYQPVAYLASQVVAGTNYAFLCKTTAVSPEAVSELKTVIVYHDLEGNSSILSVNDVKLEDYVSAEGSVEFPEEGFAGGFNTADACGAGLDADCQAAFDAALEGFTGVGYEALANLGTQVVAGTNYAVLAKATLVSAEPKSALAILTIYNGADGTQQLLNVAPFVVSQ